MPGVNRQGQAHIVSTAIRSPGPAPGPAEVEAAPTPWFRTWFSVDPQPASISPTVNISIVFICAFLVDCGRAIRIRQSKPILARSLGACRSRTVSADHDLRRKFRDVRGSRQRGLKTNYLVGTSAMKKSSIRLRHRGASRRIRSGIAFVSVCVLVGVVT